MPYKAARGDVKQKNIGSSADSWLKEEDIREEISVTTRKRVSERRMIKSETPDKLVVLSTPETRRALSPTALRGFFNIAREWSLDNNQMRGLFGGIAPSTLHAWRRSPDKRVLGQDTITRISLLVGIYKALHTYFGDPGDSWITTLNNSPLFGGAVPIDYMIHTGVIGMYEVRKMLDAWAAGH
jgi:hypothetical protein